jgi:hypothetical protein
MIELSPVKRSKDVVFVSAIAVELLYPLGIAARNGIFRSGDPRTDLGKEGLDEMNSVDGCQ